jgi:biotin carboxylase
MSRVMVFGSDHWQLAKAAELGVDVVLVQKPVEVEEESFRYCDRVYVFDYQDLELTSMVARREHAARPISRAVAHSDVGQQVVGYVNDLLGLAGNSFQTVRTLHDKFALRQVLNAQGISVVACTIARSKWDMLEFAAEHGDFVIKPRRGQGSLAARVVAGPEDLDEVWAWWERFGRGDCLLEERLVGKEFSVETFSLDGRHVAVATTDKVARGVIELGHTVPARVTDEQFEQTEAVVFATLTAAGVVDGPGHTEIMLTEHGPKVVEAHSRRCGDFVNYLVDYALGTDMEKETFRLALGGVDLDRLAMPRRSRRTAAIRYATADPGRVTSVTVPDDLRMRPGVVGMEMDTKVGDIVRELRWSHDRCGWVMVVGDEPEAVCELADACAASISIEVEPVDVADESMADLLYGKLGEKVDAFG